MTFALILFLLLGLSYLGTLLVEHAPGRGFGLASGAEYLILGWCMGPHMLGVLTAEMLEVSTPLAIAGLGYLAMVAGMGFGRSGGRRTSWSAGLLANGVSLFTAVIVALAVFVATFGLAEVAAREQFVLCVGTASVCAGTTRSAVLGAVVHANASGSRRTVLEDISGTDAPVPLVLLAVLVGLSAVGGGGGGTAGDAGLGLAFVLAHGVVAGLLVAVLTGRRSDEASAWSTLLGVGLLAVGVAMRLRIAVLAAMFVGGLVAVLSSPDRQSMRERVRATQWPVLLPVLLLGGATLDLRLAPGQVVVVVAAIGGRLAAKQIVGRLLARRLAAGPRAGVSLGLGLSASGWLAVGIAWTLSWRIPGTTSQTVMACAVASCIVGELVAAHGLSRWLGPVRPGSNV